MKTPAFRLRVRGRTKAEVFEYDDVIHHISSITSIKHDACHLRTLNERCYRISIVLAFSFGRAITIRIRHGGCVYFFGNEEKQSPFSKISEYEWTGPHTRISTSTIAFAYYTHTHVSHLNKVNAYSRGKICQERSHSSLAPFSFPRTFRRIFLTLLDVTL